MPTSTLIPPGRLRAPAGTWRTWGDTYWCSPSRREAPQSEDELAAIVTSAAARGERVKVAGSGHSFTDVACTDGALVHLGRYDRVLRVDGGARQVTVQAGITIHRLNEELARHGLALRNMGDIDYQSIAGAISTSTHGTGLRLGNLPSQLVALTLVGADGSVLECSEENDPTTFRAAQVSLGALGVISTVTLQCVPAFRIRSVERAEPLDGVLEQLDERVEGNEHFEIFFFPYTQTALAIANNVTDEPARPPGRAKRWIDDILLENHALGLLMRLGRARPPWIPALNRMTARLLSDSRVVDDSHHVFANPRLVRFQEMEYAIPRAAAREAITELRSLFDRLTMRVSFPIEVRFGPADGITLSTANGRDTCYIAVHVYHRMEYQPYFREVEAIMTAHAGRPHWGKLHFRDAASLAPRYPAWEDFLAVRDRLDPAGVFANDYLDRVIGPPLSRRAGTEAA